MFISLKKHNQIIEHKDKSILDSYSKVLKLEKEVEELKRERNNAQSLEKILDKIWPMHELLGFNTRDFTLSVSGYGDQEITLSDNVLVYVPDLLGGKVIKQEGIKAIKIDKEGKVTEGLTKEKADKGFTYKLIRE